MSFNVSIEEFSGPLDLMSHLIKENKLDLFNLDMSILADQYLAYITSMQECKLEIASEYLVELANLIEYKSKKLLPIEKSELDDNYEEDEREKLVQRIIEYEKFKDVSQKLSGLSDERNLHFTKMPSEVPSEWIHDDNTLISMDAYDLMRSIQKMYQRIAIQKPLNSTIKIKEVSVDDCLVILRDKFSRTSATHFSLIDILNDTNDMQECVITFLALLDMAKRGEIHFKLEKQDDIQIIKGAFSND